MVISQRNNGALGRDRIFGKLVGNRSDDATCVCFRVRVYKASERALKSKQETSGQQRRPMGFLDDDNVCIPCQAKKLLQFAATFTMIEIVKGTEVQVGTLSFFT